MENINFIIFVTFVPAYAGANFGKDEVEIPKPPPVENPISRTLRVLKNDMKTLKHSIPFISKEPYKKQWFTEHCDVVVIGGGVIGSSIAYWLQTKVRDGVRVVVVEKDPTYAKASTPLSCGGIRQQFSLAENIQISKFGAEFLRNVKKYLSVDGESPPDIQFTPCGYLFLATEAGAEQLQANVRLQHELGVKNELLTAKKLKQKFPFLNTEGIALGCHGLENEGWFDPWSLLMAFKKKAIASGAEYVTGEAVGFEFKKMPDMFVEGMPDGTYESVQKVLVRLENGEIKSIKFGLLVIAAGAESAKVAELARIGTGQGYLKVPVPVEPRKRFVYCVHCPEAPGLKTPFIIDPSGTYVRREGLGGHYICGKSPTLEEGEPSTENLDVDYGFFDTGVWPHLANRVPAFEGLKMRNAWGGFYDFNVFDENGIVGPHPGYHNVYVATGFSGHGIQQAPAVGRAVMEMMFEGGFKTIDLTRLGFDRLLYDEPLYEQNIV